MNMLWTDADKEYIRANAHRIKDSEISSQLSKVSGRPISVQAVRKQRQKMNIKKCHGRGICKIVGDPKP